MMFHTRRPRPTRTVRAGGLSAVVAGVLGLGLVLGLTGCGDNTEEPDTPTVEPLRMHGAVGAQPVLLDSPAQQLALPDPAPEISAADRAGLAEELDEVLARTPGRTAVDVVVANSGETLFERDADHALVPASSLKILTGLAAYDVLGPDHRYTTTAVWQDNTVVLVAGGDVLLGTGDHEEGTAGRAGLGELARDTVAALVEREVSGTVQVRVDDSGYTGPELAESWVDSLVTTGNIAPVQPLATYGARAEEGTGTERVQDPALHAAEVFQASLTDAADEAGVDLSFDDDVARTQAPAEAGSESVLASADSATVAEQVEYVLVNSDNQVAEATARNAAAVSGRDPSFTGVAELLTATATTYGVNVEGLRVVDGSGLSHGNRASPRQLVQIMNAAATHPRMSPLIWGLPLAGWEGTLSERMEQAPAAGVVRAKTGTLSSTVSLTGTVVTTDGVHLWFSLITHGDDLEGALLEARDAQDEFATVLAGWTTSSS